jgi:glutathione S-transferase
MVWGVFVPESDNRDDRQAIAPALAKSKTILRVVQEFLGDSGYFSLHSSPGLTDYWALLMFDCFDLSPSGRKVLADHPALHAWLVRMRDNADDLDRDILATAV